MIGKIRTKSLEELINQPRLVKYDTYEFDELSYTCLLVDIKMLLEENKKYKEVINNAIDLINHDYVYDSNAFEDRTFQQDLLKILKEVEHEKIND